MNVSIHGRSGCWSVPRMPSGKSTCSVRKRSKRLAESNLQHARGGTVFRRECQRRGESLPAAFRPRVLHAQPSFQRGRVDIARELYSHGRGHRNVCLILSRRAEHHFRRWCRPGRDSSGGGRFGRGLRSLRLPACASSHLQSAALLQRAGDFEPAPGVDPRVEREVEVAAARLDAGHPDRCIDGAQHEIVRLLAGRVRRSPRRLRPANWPTTVTFCSR